MTTIYQFHSLIFLKLVLYYNPLCEVCLELHKMNEITQSSLTLDDNKSTTHQKYQLELNFFTFVKSCYGLQVHVQMFKFDISSDQNICNTVKNSDDLKYNRHTIHRPKKLAILGILAIQGCRKSYSLLKV